MTTCLIPSESARDRESRTADLSFPPRNRREASALTEPTIRSHRAHPYASRSYGPFAARLQLFRSFFFSTTLPSRMIGFLFCWLIRSLHSCHLDIRLRAASDQIFHFGSARATLKNSCSTRLSRCSAYRGPGLIPRGSSRLSLYTT